MDYREALKYLNSFIDYERIEKYSYEGSFKLDRVKKLLNLLGNPHRSLRCIHVAGTKGKGSVCVMTAYILKEAGFKVGLYTSPHLHDFRERIRILNSNSDDNLEFGGMITKENICRLTDTMKPSIEKVQKEFEAEPLTFFEVYTAVMFLYFKQKKIDYAVIEVGLGGRLDATNAIENPLVCCITPISLEHTDKLGVNIANIAREKSMIIKKGCKVVSAPQREEVLNQIQKLCQKNSVELFLIGKDKDSNLKVNLLGEHQLMNAACAVKTIKCLPVEVRKEAIQRGLNQVRWPGRFEVLGEKPYTVVDGAQNTASAAVLAEQVGKLFSFDRLVLVVGFCKDKDIEGICEILLAISNEIIVTKSQNPRAVEPKEIFQIIRNKNSNIPLTLTDNARQAMKIAYQKASGNDLILITGSIFVVAETRKKLHPKESLDETEVLSR